MRNNGEKIRAGRNQTLIIKNAELFALRKKLFVLNQASTVRAITNKVIHQDLFNAMKFLPQHFVDLLFVDPPYNLTKEFNTGKFKEMATDEYELWFDSWMKGLRRILKPTASIYVCGDWKCSSAIFRILSRYFKVRNRITWEREKGRGALSNWKNCSEDIWFCTVSDDFVFNVNAVRMKRKVVAPYRDDSGNPKDWSEDKNGNYRLTYPSN